MTDERPQADEGPRDDQRPPPDEGPRQEQPQGDQQGESAYELLQRGSALLGRRHHAQAAVVLQRAADLEPRRGSILEPLGRAYFMSGQLERAQETFTALLEVDPVSAYGHYALGRTLARLGRPLEASTHLRVAVALAPDSALYRGALARLGATGRRRDR
ncbi:MAG: tetratricopeptide repeat protein [Chloroflexi bacterium]|jgi:Flp pilus assembly protein TadD|nr:tetratricopeptide repeat protein [Chloroflexota bacterium]